MYKKFCRSKDKLKVFRDWLANNKNYQDTESHILFLREKEFQGKRQWECLTILEMVQRNFSVHGTEQFHGMIYPRLGGTCFFQ